MNETLIYQKLQRRYQDLKDQKYQFLIADEGARPVESSKAVERLQKVNVLLEQLQQDSPEKVKTVTSQLAGFLETASQKIRSL